MTATSNLTATVTFICAYQKNFRLFYFDKYITNRESPSGFSLNRMTPTLSA